MSSITTYCPNCGTEFYSIFKQECPHCALTSTASERPAPKLWGAGTGVLVWLGSLGLLIGFQIIAAIVWFVYKYLQIGALPQLEMDWLLTVLSVGSSFPAHIVTLYLCWLVVTDNGRRSFGETLGWSWHTQFKWVHAVALAFLMIGFGLLIQKFVPNQETELDKILRMGTSVRVLVAALAVLTAPFVEEMVYRGVLYSGIERAWGKQAGIVVVTLLFAGVHFFQYRASYAALTLIIALSLVLTLLRAATGKLLPCVATHFVYNGLNALLLLLAPDRLPDSHSVKTAVILLWHGVRSIAGS
ncbi:MAG: CPBP family intramembrane metalloprotease [Blastocatellia bacterium]|nr:CPBP family intramembrane metalloprotease [Blastocatellia bacterium]